MRLSIPLICFLLLLGTSYQTVEGADSKRPNIIFIVADDMHRHMFNCLPEGKGRNLTPNLDRLAAEGTLLMGQHVASPVCTPSRYSCLTGMYASRSRCDRFINNTRREGQTVVQWNAHITDEVTLPHLLRQAGYVTGMVGKNHVIEADVEKIAYHADPTHADVAEKLQNRQKQVEQAIHNVGFDFVASVYHENPDGNGPRELAVHNLDWTTDGALTFIDDNHDKPFFLYYATTTPHGPGEKDRSWNADPTAIPTGYLEEPLDVLPPRHTIPVRLKRAGLRSDPSRCNLLWMDDSIGAILTKLEELQIDDNTVVLFFNDHGQAAKGTLYQGGVTNPSIIWRKGGFACGSVNQALVSNIDFTPTLLDMAGVSYDTDQFDGRSVLPILNGEAESVHDSLYFEMGYSRAVVKDGWKYIALRYPENSETMPISKRQEILDQFNAKQKLRGRPIHNTDPATPFSHVSLIPGGGDAEAVSTGKRPGYYDRDQLYELESDPQENNNLAYANEHSAKLAELKRELQQYLEMLPGNFAELKSSASSNQDPCMNTIVRRYFTCIALTIGLLGCPSWVHSAEKQRPNIVLFFLDDFGIRDLSCYGGSFYETPHMDRLATEGMRFNNAYSAYPRCVPSRIGLLSGKIPARIENSSGDSAHALPLTEFTFGEALKEAGYQTCYIGKWHLGKEGGDPGAQGFDTVIHSGSAGAPQSYFYPFPMEHGEAIVNPVDGKEGDYLTDRLTDKAVDYIDNHAGKPFLLVMAHYAVHTPFEAPEDLKRKYRQKLRKAGVQQGGGKDDADFIRDRQGFTKTEQNNPIYAAMIEAADTSLGRIQQALKKSDIADKSIIILTSDHGGLSTRGLENGRPVATSNLPYRQGKGSIFDGGTRVPMIVKWPGHVLPGKVSDVQVTGTDHYPSLLEMAGVPIRPLQHVDGQSYLPALAGDTYQRAPMFWYKWQARPDSTGDTRAISYIDGNYKVVQWLDEELVELFDLAQDPGERNNLSGAYPEKTAALLTSLLQMEEGVGNLREKGRKALERRLERKQK